jgi:hypothetical protein
MEVDRSPVFGGVSITVGGEGVGDGRKVLAVNGGVGSGGGLVKEYRFENIGTLKLGVPGDTLRTLEDPYVEFGREDLTELRTSNDFRVGSRGSIFCIDIRLLFLKVVVIAAPRLSIGTSSGRFGSPAFDVVGEFGGD